MRKGMLGAIVAGLGWAVAAGAQTGATAGTPMQAGAWSGSGWQAGAAPAARPATTVPIDTPPAAPSAPMLPYDGYDSSYGAAYAQPPVPHRPITVGRKLPGGYADPIYTVRDWRGYGLEQPYPGTRWVRYFEEAVMVDARGRAIAVVPVAWNAPRRGTAPLRPEAPRWTPPVASTHTERHGDTVVTTQVIPPPHGVYGNGYGPDYGWGPGVTVTPSIVTTTTVTTVDRASAASRSRRRAHRR